MRRLSLIYPATLLLWVACGNAQDAASDEDVNLKKDGEGWVLEFNKETPPAKNDAAPPAAESGASGGTANGPGIEMIIGGQGKDGVAKKGTLPLAD